MGRPPVQPQKRPHVDAKPQLPPLSDAERKLYDLIKSKNNMGVWKANMRTETGLPDSIATKALKSLQAKYLVKEVVNFRNKRKKIYMAVEFEPSKEITGGFWYLDGSLDKEFIAVLRMHCRRYVEQVKVATIEMIADSIRESRVFKRECSTQQISEILGAMVLDKEIEEIKSSGLGDFFNIPRGKTCYHCPKGMVGGPQVGALTSIPCGVCPRLSECTPDGIISPKTCVYYDRWLSSMEF